MAQPPQSNQQGEFGIYLCAGLDRHPLHAVDVLRALSRVPRHRFVPPELQDCAYEDRALAIGSDQTISQPYIVAYMTQEAHIRPGDKVLEVGTGSGYQAAVLTELGAKVFSIEILPELAEQADKVLRELGYTSITIRCGDGWQGWPEESPFDAILVPAAAPIFPTQLLAQLADGGRMIIPLEDEKRTGEQLMLFERHGNNITSQELGLVKFVPLTGSARNETTKKSSGSQGCRTASS